MKRNGYILISMMMLFVSIMSSCKKDFIELNTDPNGTPNALPQQLLAPALVNTLGTNMLRARNFNNELMQVTVDPGDSEGKVFRYDIKRTWADATWNAWYTQLTNFKDIYTIASKEVTYNKTYMGISLICQSWLYSLLTDTYGDVPYFDSNKGKDGNFTPKFDKQKDIYLDIFKNLEAADTLLNASANVVAGSDPVFSGNALKWRKFGNTLYLRLLLRVSGKADVSADVIAKIKQIVDTNPDAYPIMGSNDDSAVLRWTGSGALTSPFIGGVREQDWRQPGVCEFFVNNLAKWADPRLVNNRWSISSYQGGIQGIPSGYAPGENVGIKSYFQSTTSTTTLMNDPLMGNIMNYSELQFILAEAAAKGWIAGDAATYYKNGVQTGITFWIPTYTVPIDTYLAGADITWDNAAPLDEKMEMIHVQKYYSMFYTDFEQWFEYRRTGHPVLPKGNGLRNNGIMPARLQYPVYVQSANPDSYKAAVAAQGADEISTQVWWQKQ
ncbi:SusD/RagB family nutrient-binding outer membrane lipoprotein [Mucilaginibacter rubeus]|uniref:SusD/RagB family nutrient-binding outer membrane lipoprotein n=1 Tax=Mucilaginibacter rubeus TaxID=2027860 RepID=A0AAE6MGR9_9SPHI|nr:MULTISPECIES: SusD/RagB family nutrient-binding outer membrane lipoprotein [Mucilaginibacter]QEM02766.1 SusD/RagB family nutrient-binding outer membrane lipoprotein [Mucilaginibacter rubeus]QEM15385.1 SusD/RagB family nutrient-binding outer membrane lipoprotein [Mucilaginibacter gossypii]QTE41886.1 SusD/RagB family nutrient-binding outer membrane lipoprotein [Mucilaginibacter rubeus]QTE48489.1 SusD/RagB family nutrient-binding outer membrane lipoprotein [Mucilaginibacter rubeus]QTE59875.1 S